MRYLKSLIPLKSRSIGSDRISKLLAAVLVVGSLSAVGSMAPAQAVPVTAVDDSAGICTQNVSDSTGIIVTKIGNDCVVQFKNTGSITWTPSTNISVRYLVVAGGGSGTRGYCGIYWGQGGGGGEVLTGSSLSLTANVPVTVDVGLGAPRTGDCTETAGSDGWNSVLGSLTARGGKASLNSRTSSPTGAFGGISGNGNPGGNGGANGVNCTGGSCGAGGGGGAGGSGSGFDAGQGINSDIITTGSNVMYGSGGAGWAGGVAGLTRSGGATPGSSLCDAPANQGGGGSDCYGHAATGGKGGSGLIVVRYTFDITAPTFSSSSISVDGLNLTLTYSETLSATTAAPANFVVTVNSTETRTVSSVSTSGSSVLLTLGSRIESGQSIAVTYTDPTGGNDANAVQDLWGNDAATLSNQSITNTLNSTNDSAISLNGTSQYANSPDNSAFDITTTLTLAAWVNPTISNTNMTVAGKAGAYLLQTNGGFWRYCLQGTAAPTSYVCVSTQIPVVTGQWQHVAFTRAANVVNFYLNGSLAFSGSADGAASGNIANSAEPFQVGRFLAQAYFAGHIDEVKLWNVARTQAQVQSDLKTYGGSLSDGLVAYYDFNDQSGSTLINRSTGGSSALNLTLFNSPSLTSAEIFETSIVQAYTVVRFMRNYLVSSGGYKFPDTSTAFQYLIVGGGGGGGGGFNGGGGGGGGFRESTTIVNTSSPISVVVGQGGNGAVTGFGPTNGETSTIFGISSTGGGKGATEQQVMSGPSAATTPDGKPTSGGSGGGGGHGATFSGVDGAAGNSGGYAPIEGFAGGVGNSNSSNACCYALAGGGGGGAGGAGGNASNNGLGGTPGAGGIGRTSYITGSALNLAGGGGGGGRYGDTGGPIVRGSSASFGGGSGAQNTSAEQNATFNGVNGSTNTGGGGGGGASTLTGTAGGGNGGSGFIAVRYITNKPTIITQPLSDTTTAGIVGTFTITTSAAPAPLTKSVQWQFSTDTVTGTTGWANAATGSGFTTDTFTTVALTKAMNKYRYRAIVTFSDTSTIMVQETSTVVILTINDSITITSDTSTITRKYGDAQSVRTIVYSGGTTNTGAVGTSTSHTLLGQVGNLASGRIVLDTSTSTVVFRVDTRTAVGSYVETITVTDFKGATASYAQRVVVNPADTLTVQADTLTAITYDPAGMTINPTVIITGLVASDSATSTTLKYSAPGSNCANGGTCSLGDSGPGGGKVFYVSGSTYFEAAPRNWYSSITYNGSTYNNANTVYCANGSNQKIDPYNPPNNTSSTGWGGGKTNTDAFKTYCSMGAIGLIKSYAGGGKSDWYIPNATEMNGVVNYWSNISGLLTQFDTTTSISFWTSDASYNATYGWLLTQPYFNSSRTWSGSGSAFNHQGGKILPIRSFTVDGLAQPALIATETKPTNAGTYSITPSTLVLANNIDTSNYVWVDYRTSTFIINKARQDTLTITSKFAPFNGASSTMKLTTLGGNETGTVTYSIAPGGTAGACSVNTNVLTVTSAGTCNLVATKAATLNYLITYSDTVTVTFSLFVSNQQTQTQLYPTMLPINGANSLETTTVTVPTISSVTYQAAYSPAPLVFVEASYTINGSGFTGTTRVLLNFAEVPFFLNSDSNINITATNMTSPGLLFIECSDGRSGPSPFYFFTPSP